MNIRTYLKEHKLITDGAFGTYYSEKYHTDEMPEYANLLHPERVKEIHSSYIKAGAHLLRTNTFACNTVALQKDWSAVQQHILAAVQIAKEVTGHEDEIVLAGDIGPIAFEPGRPLSQVQEEYYQIASLFLNEGLTVLTFETFPDAEIITPVIDRIRSEWGTDPFIMVQLCINQFGYSTTGFRASKLFASMAESETIDAIGFNCGIGPAHMEQIFKDLNQNHNKYVIAIPNGGYPTMIRNRIVFANQPDYFAAKMSDLANLGADIIGGCCGTTPECIQIMTETIDLTPKKRIPVTVSLEGQSLPTSKHGFLYHENGQRKEHKLIAVELAPPLNAEDSRILAAARILEHAGIDVLTFPDSPSGRTRIDSVLMASKIHHETGLRVMPHICCRDKNAIAMRSLFLGAKINDIEDFLIITGDPVPSTNRQSVKSVFDFDSVRLMKILQEMNEDVFADKPMCYGGSINQGRRNLDVEINRIKKKMEAGAEFFLTQPIFTKDSADCLRRIKEQTGARILCGIMPLISRRNAMFMMNEIAGVQVTDDVIARYPEHGTKAAGEAVGIALAKEMIESTADFADGYYFSFPFNRVYLLEQILQGIHL
ncbi:MAG: bifunctional homocysteine S-methyltransferase/methylenetetrahydrofolate reductase [Hespellia sp.]|nr:bifunctional homocysteine S-methyltransferase/methylenetetrahydrofolate reductase [Hespellia sp.]